MVFKYFLGDRLNKLEVRKVMYDENFINFVFFVLKYVCKVNFEFLCLFFYEYQLKNYYLFVILNGQFFFLEWFYIIFFFFIEGIEVESKKRWMRLIDMYFIYEIFELCKFIIYLLN